MYNYNHLIPKINYLYSDSLCSLEPKIYNISYRAHWFFKPQMCVFLSKKLGIFDALKLSLGHAQTHCITVYILQLLYITHFASVWDIKWLIENKLFQKGNYLIRNLETLGFEAPIIKLKCNSIKQWTYLLLFPDVIFSHLSLALWFETTEQVFTNKFWCWTWSEWYLLSKWFRSECLSSLTSQLTHLAYFSIRS